MQERTTRKDAMSVVSDDLEATGGVGVRATWRADVCKQRVHAHGMSRQNGCNAGVVKQVTAHHDATSEAVRAYAMQQRCCNDALGRATGREAQRRKGCRQSGGGLRAGDGRSQSAMPSAVACERQLDRSVWIRFGEVYLQCQLGQAAVIRMSLRMRARWSRQGRNNGQL